MLNVSIDLVHMYITYCLYLLYAVQIPTLTQLITRQTCIPSLIPFLPFETFPVDPFSNFKGTPQETSMPELSLINKMYGSLHQQK